MTATSHRIRHRWSGIVGRSKPCRLPNELFSTVLGTSCFQGSQTSPGDSIAKHSTPISRRFSRNRTSISSSSRALRSRPIYPQSEKWGCRRNCVTMPSTPRPTYNASSAGSTGRRCAAGLPPPTRGSRSAASSDSSANCVDRPTV